MYQNWIRRGGLCCVVISVAFLAGCSPMAATELSTWLPDGPTVARLAETIVTEARLDTGSNASPDAAAQHHPDVVVTYTNDTFPPDCDPEYAARTILGFMDAFNRGDPAQLRRFFDRATFDRFGMGPQASPGKGIEGFLAYDPDSGLVANTPGIRDGKQTGYFDALLPFLL